MTAIEKLSEEEIALLVILMDPSGIDQAEFCWEDPERDDGCFRAWDFQKAWWRDDSPFQVDLSARSVGKTTGIVLRMFAFAFWAPGQEAVITAPTMNHLTPVTDLIEQRLRTTRLSREMLPKKANLGFTHRPFAVTFLNGARLMGRIPQLDGTGVKGTHPLILEQDECFPAGTLVTERKRGQVPIEEIQVGDQVLSHKRRWRRVLNVAGRERPTVELVGHGHPGLVASENHKFWAARVTEGYHFESCGNQHTEEREGGNRLIKANVTGGPEWIRANEMEGAYWSTPMNTPPAPIPSFLDAGQRRTNAKIPCEMENEDFFWVVGNWIAEGSWNPAAHQVTWSVHTDERPELQKRLDQLGINWWEIKVSDYCYNVSTGSVMLGRWLAKYFGRGAHNKQIASWVFGVRRDLRKALLDGLVYGDGFYCKDARYEEGRWKLATASKKLAVSARMLAVNLGWWAPLYWNPPPEEPVYIRGRQVHGSGWYQLVGSAKGQGFDFDHSRFTSVKDVRPTGRIEKLYDLEVEIDHSFVADGFCVSNSQDYPHQGFVELIETVKQGSENFGWRVHGVSNGARDMFYKISRPDSGWKVHKITAIDRPTWSDAERKNKIESYGSRNAPDYRRNILGEPGAAEDYLFVLRRLAKNIDLDESSEYNQDIFESLRVRAEELEDYGGPISDLIKVPTVHKKLWKTFWIGVDLGLLQDPTEILVFGESTPKGQKDSVLTLLLRVQMERIRHGDHTEAMAHLIMKYNPQAIALDKTGIGQPIFQDMQDRFPSLAKKIRGYGFSEKLTVGFDETIEFDEDMGDEIEETKIVKNVLEHSSDVLRDLVDAYRLKLPNDDDIINSFRGETFSTQKKVTDLYGRRKFSNANKSHILDAARMAAMAWSQAKVEAFIESKQEKDDVILPQWA